MDEQLSQRWKTAGPPFDGQCIRLTEPLDDLTVGGAYEYVVETVGVEVADGDDVGPGVHLPDRTALPAGGAERIRA